MIGTIGSTDTQNVAFLIVSLSRLTGRDNTLAVCKYKLCGITTAPMIPVISQRLRPSGSTNPYTKPSIAFAGSESTRPHSMKIVTAITPINNTITPSSQRIPPLEF